MAGSELLRKGYEIVMTLGYVNMRYNGYVVKSQTSMSVLLVNVYYFLHIKLLTFVYIPFAI